MHAEGRFLDVDKLESRLHIVRCSSVTGPAAVLPPYAAALPAHAPVALTAARSDNQVKAMLSRRVVV